MKSEETDRQFVTALARGLEILRCFRAGEPLLGNQEIAARTGLPKPTVSRLTHTLTVLGYLVHVARFGKYRLGTAAMSLGYTALASLDIRDLARPLMQELADYSDVAVALGSFDRTSMIYVEICRGKSALTIRLGSGSRIPVATTAMGRAYLAAISESERDKVLEQVRLRRPQDWRLIADGVAQGVRDLRQRGFTLSVGEWQSDVHAVGTAVRTPDGRVYGLNLGGAAFMLPKDRLVAELGPRLARLGRAIEEALGRRSP